MVTNPNLECAIGSIFSSKETERIKSETEWRKGHPKKEGLFDLRIVMGSKVHLLERTWFDLFIPFRGVVTLHLSLPFLQSILPKISPLPSPSLSSIHSSQHFLSLIFFFCPFFRFPKNKYVWFMSSTKIHKKREWKEMFRVNQPISKNSVVRLFPLPVLQIYRGLGSAYLIHQYFFQ